MDKKIYARLVSIVTAMTLTFGTVCAQTGFNYSVSPGMCRPYTVTFTNTTVGATTYKWYFGDGDSSTMQNPVHIYKHGSRFNVMLQAWNGGTHIGDMWQDVYLPGGPNRLETDKDSVCPGDEVYFYINGMYNNSMWDFGEGAGFQYDEHRHTFSSPGSKNVRVKFDVPGCGSDTLSRIIIADGNAKPAVNFWLPDSVCPNEIVNFGLNNTYATYLWAFGDGQTSTESNPGHAYGSTGKKYISLNVTNACGKSNSRNDSIIITNKNKWKAYEKNIWLSNNTACTGQSIHFNYCCSPAFYSVWKFGDGDSIVNQQNADHSYSANGTYTVTLRLRNGCGHDTIITSTVKIGMPSSFGGNPQLVSDADSLCPSDQLGFEVRNLNWSSNNDFTFHWNFGDGITEDNTNSSPNHSYSASGQKTVTVRVVNMCNKDTTLQKIINVSTSVKPVLKLGENWGTPSMTACPNDSVIFYAQGGKSYLWNFGDGTTTTKTTPLQVDQIIDIAGHSFKTKNNYKVKLTYFNSCGNSTTDSLIFPVTDTAKPSGDFMFDNNKEYSLCDPVGFLAIGASSYKFNFGDGDSLTTTDMMIMHQFKKTGDLTITVTFSNHCGKTSVKSSTIHINNIMWGVPNDSAKACPGDSALLIASGGSNYKFYFGDGTSSTNLIPFKEPNSGMDMVIVRHPYAAIGTYKVKLTMTNLCGLPFADSLQFVVGNSGIKPNADMGIFTPEQNRRVCSPISLVSLGGKTYTWKFGDGDTLKTNAGSAVHRYKAPGDYTIRLYATNGCGLKDSTSQMIKIDRQDMGVSDSAACSGDSILFYANGGTNYLLKFGDGQQSAPTGKLEVMGNIYDIVRHAYAANGTYTTVISFTNGCALPETDSIIVKINGSRPVNGSFEIMSFQQSEPACKPIQMLANGGSIYKFVFGDGDSLTTNVGMIEHGFRKAGYFTVTCKITNGCGNTQLLSKNILITDMMVSGTVTNPLCNGDAGGSVNTLVIGGSAPYTYHWNNNQEVANASSLVAGSYTLTVTDAFGCKVVKSFTVNEPAAISITSNITNTSTCLATDGSATVTSSGGTPGYTYEWSSGETSNGIGGKGANVYTITVTDANSCAKSFQIAINSTGGPAVTLASFADKCENATNFMLSGGSPATGAYMVDGVSATSFNPSAKGPGVYSVSYTYSSAGCTGSDIKTITVHALPDVSLGVFDAVCKNTSVLVFNTGYPAGGTFTLDGTAATSINPATATVGAHAVIYNYTDAHGCAAADTQTLTVKDFTPVALTFPAGICEGDIKALTGGTPAGGIYLVDGQSATSFNAQLLDVSTHTVTYLYSSGGCSDTASQSVIIAVCDRLQNNTISNLEVYPNPTDGILNVNFSTSAKQVMVKMISATGQVMSVENVYNTENVKKVFDLSKYPAGIYMIVIVAEGEVSSAKIILSK